MPDYPHSRRLFQSGMPVCLRLRIYQRQGRVRVVERYLDGLDFAAARSLKMGHVAQVMQAYPSPAIGNQQIAGDAYLGGLTQRLTGCALRWLTG